MTAVSSRKAGRPTSAETQAIVRAILATAARHFLQKGFAATSFDEIAAECRLSRSGLYARFPNKSALFAATCLALVEAFYAETMSKADETAPFELALGQLAKAILGMVAEGRGRTIYRILVQEAQHAAELEASVRSVWTLYHDHASAFFARRMAAGEIPPGDPDETASMFLDLILSQMNMHHIMGLELPPARELYARNEQVLAMFAQHLRGSPARR